MNRAYILLIAIASVTIVTVVIVVSVVLTTNSDDPRPQLDSVVAVGK